MTNKRKSRRWFRAERIAAVLVLLTLGLWIVYESGLNRRLVLEKKHIAFPVKAYDDRREGGTSLAQLEQTDSTWLLHYELRHGSPYPFALINIDLTRNGKGMDLSKFDEIRVWAKASGPYAQRIRLQLRNSNPSYTVESDPMSLSYNEVHFPAYGLDSAVELSWSDFHMAGWWLARKNISFEKSKVDVSDVHWIELLNPEPELDGTGTIELKRIEFRGKYFPAVLFFKVLLVLWMSVWSLFVLVRMWQLREMVVQKELREQELVQLNELLAVQAKELESKALRDELTGLLNRHGLRDYLFNALEQARLHDMNLSLIFADIDFFKKINDSQGHSEGDRILKNVAQTIQNSIRETDMAARWGGEEFLIICQGSRLESARLLAEKLRRTIEALPDHVTCSFGVSSMQDGSINELVKKADKALYYAKEMGRNRVEVCM